MKVCSRCKESLDRDKFYSDNRAKDRLQSACKECGNQSRRKVRGCLACSNSLMGTGRQLLCDICLPSGPEYHKWNKLYYRFKLTPAMWQAMYLDQDGQCAMKSCTNEATHVDHDHSCCPGRQTCGRCVRGLLCTHCNTKLHSIENEQFLQDALFYLQLTQRQG